MQVILITHKYVAYSFIRTNYITQQALVNVSYDFHIAGNGLYTMLVTTVKDSKSKSKAIPVTGHEGL
jgi:hypothetical protein